jgi:sulfonate transport system substrate-binding protein
MRFAHDAHVATPPSAGKRPSAKIAVSGVGVAVTAFLLLPLAMPGWAQTNSARPAAPSSEFDLSQVTLVVGTAGPRFKASWDFSHPAVPYNVQFAAFDGSAPIVEALSAGAVDIGLPGDIGVILAHAAGASIDIVGIEKGNPDFLRLIVPSGSTIGSLRELKGKTIAVAKATAAHMFLLKAIKAAGFDVLDFKWAYLSNPDAGAAFQRGDVDAWATWDPFAASAEIKWGAKLVKHAEPETVGAAYWVARPGFFAKDSAKTTAARDFIARYVAVNRNEINQRPAWSKTLARALKLDDAIAQQVAEHYYFTSVPLDKSAEADYRQTAQLLLEQKLIQTVPDPAKHFDFASVNPVIQAAVVQADK